MIDNLNKRLKHAKIHFPEYWNHENVIEKLIELSDESLYEYFGAKSKAAFSRKMNPYFPAKPANMSFRRYVEEAISKVLPPAVTFGSTSD